MSIFLVGLNHLLGVFEKAIRVQLWAHYNK